MERLSITMKSHEDIKTSGREKLKKKKPRESEIRDKLLHQKIKKKKKKKPEEESLAEKVSLENIKKKKLKKKKKLLAGLIEDRIPVDIKKKKLKKKKKPLSALPSEESSLQDLKKKKKLKKKKLSSETLKNKSTATIKKKKSLDEEPIIKKKKKKSLDEEPIIKKKQKKFLVKKAKKTDDIFDDFIIQTDKSEIIDFSIINKEINEINGSEYLDTDEKDLPLPIELLQLEEEDDLPPPEVDEDNFPRPGFFGSTTSSSVKDEISPVVTQEAEVLPEFNVEFEKELEIQISNINEMKIEDVLKDNYEELTDSEKDGLGQRTIRLDNINIEDLLREQYGEIKDFEELPPLEIKGSSSGEISSLPLNDISEAPDEIAADPEETAVIPEEITVTPGKPEEGASEKVIKKKKKKKKKIKE
ncbi:MAG: hypothetical protein BWY64_00012 [bacterium ADurb.Bin363]|nr:MAG: hypothetical protein BWY64_00012 [bacterium ADurb.Bin363]